MMLKSLIGMLVAMGLAGPALAQSSDPFRTGVERRVSAGIVIPFGPRGTADKPQLELRSTAIRHDHAEVRSFDGDGWLPRRERTTRIGLTLEQSSKFMVNGREVADPSGRRNLSTIGYIAIGVGVATAVAGLLLLEELRSSDPDER